MYSFKIQNGDYSCINEALAFTNKKYTELCATDADLVIEKKIISTSKPIDKDIVKRTLNNLKYIYDLIAAKIVKELTSK